MARTYLSPEELVEALHERGDGARAQLHDTLRAAVSRLMGDLAVRYRLAQRGDVLTRNALHAAEMHLRTRSVASFAGLTWQAFRAALLLHVAKLASQPHGQDTTARATPERLPPSSRYHSDSYFLPFERSGDSWFSGDWYGGVEAADGSLWILLADITGHGYHAYLLASTLSGVWQHCWQAGPAAPAELLGTMHDLLVECLPEGVYVECTLARLTPEGELLAAPAGGSRLLLRRSREAKPSLLQLRGAWLGLIRPTTNDQRTWKLEEGDELLLATDGLFDQLLTKGSTNVLEQLGRIGSGAGLFEHVRQLLQRTLEHSPQQDDITMVFLRRDERAQASSYLPREEVAAPNETRDVSV